MTGYKLVLLLSDRQDIDLSAFYDGVRAFFEGAVDYGLKSLPLDDQLLQAATFISFDQRATADSLHAEYFINRYNYYAAVK